MGINRLYVFTVPWFRNYSHKTGFSINLVSHCEQNLVTWRLLTLFLARTKTKLVEPKCGPLGIRNVFRVPQTIRAHASGVAPLVKHQNRWMWIYLELQGKVDGGAGRGGAGGGASASAVLAPPAPASAPPASATTSPAEGSAERESERRRAIHGISAPWRGKCWKKFKGLLLLSQEYKIQDMFTSVFSLLFFRFP